MNYSMTNVEATLCLTPEPVVVLKTPSLPGAHQYLASQFLDCAGKGKRFGIGPAFNDQDPVVIAAIEVAQFADWIRGQVTPEIGEFKTIWIANDPRVPF